MSEAVGYAHVVDGKVVSATLWDGLTEVARPDGVTLVPLPYTLDEDGSKRYTAGIGWDYVDGEFVDNRPTEVDDDLDT
jgi:hypothetical protein